MCSTSRKNVSATIFFYRNIMIYTIVKRKKEDFLLNSIYNISHDNVHARKVIITNIVVTLTY